MKRIITLFFLILILITLSNIKSITSYNKLIDKKTYKEYVLLLDNLNINTNNLTKYFSNIEIMSVEPFLSPLLEGRISSEFLFNHPLITKNINLLISYYRNKLLSMGLKDQVDQIDYLGLKIKKIKIITSGAHINNLTKQFPNLKYE